MDNLSIFAPISPVEITHAETHWRYADIGLHSHREWELIYQREGVVETVQGGESFEMRPGMILLHPPDIAHMDIHTEDYSIYYVRFKSIDPLPWPRLSYDDSPRNIGRICELIYREYHSNDCGREKLMSLLAGELDVFMQRLGAHQSVSASARIVSQAKRILEEHYNDAPSVSELASLVGVSQSWLYLHFMNICGVSPKQYLQSVRMHHALGLLRHTDLTLDSIAASCGFSSVSHLSRQVKAATGLQPGALRHPRNN
jgi:AraC-like DNA-binding protein